MSTKLILMLIALFSWATLADLQVFPTRVLLTESAKSGQISLRHRGTKPMSYRIEVVYYKMNPDGTMVLVPDPATAEQSASAMFRFSPKQVTLEPNIEQVVRVLLRMKPDAPEGDYRAHLYFEGIEEKEEAPLKENKSETAEMNLKARLAIAVPIVVRKGTPEIKAELEGLKTVTSPDGKLSYAAEIKRTGKSFLYGDLTAIFIPQGSTTETVVGQANGISSYIEKRSVSYPLTVPKLEKGTLKLVLRAPSNEGGAVLATTSTEIK